MTQANPAPGGRALVTGASGFVGRHLCQALLQRAYRVTAMQHRSALPNCLSSLASPRATGTLRLCRAALAQPDSLFQACQDTHVVFHLASIAHAGTTSEADLQDTIVNGTRQLAVAARRAGVSAFVYFSSSLACVADHSPQASSYARCKKTAEDALLAQADRHFRVCVLRPVNVYGPGMKGNLASLVQRIRAGRMPPLPRLAHPVPLVAVQDLCRAAILAAENVSSAGRIYTVTDGQNYTPNSIEEGIYQALGRKKTVRYSPRVVFFLAAAGAQVANHLGLWRNDLGLRTYRNLIGQGAGAALFHDSSDANNHLTADLGYRPQHTFYGELPGILATL